MPEPATKETQLESLSLEDLLEELTKYRLSFWERSEEENYSLERARNPKVCPQMKISWAQYQLGINMYQIVIRKEVFKRKNLLNVNSLKQGYVFTNIPRSFQLKILLEDLPVKVYEEDIENHKCLIYRRLESFFEGLEKSLVYS